MIEGGTINPDCNFEVEWSDYKTNSIKNKEDFFKILKDILWHREDEDHETYLMLDLDISDKDGEQFNENYKEDKNPLIPYPTKEEPFQLIHEHILKDPYYEFDYLDEKLPLNIEYQMYDGRKLLTNIDAVSPFSFKPNICITVSLIAPAFLIVISFEILKS